MSELKKNVIIISASSDIGAALARKWAADGWQVYGTFRTVSPVVEELRSVGITMSECDLRDNESIRSFFLKMKTDIHAWDVLIVAPGELNPVGDFKDVDFDEWDNSVRVNFTNQLRVVHGLLPSRNLKSEEGPAVIFFAGGGTNNAPTHYSAYMVSKVALIKMTELLAAEIDDTRFVIIGPGWVKTKIHEATFQAKERAGDNFQVSSQKWEQGAGTPMEKIIECFEWALSAPRNAVSGRNFSVVYDRWGDPKLEEYLANDENMYKLRRAGNEVLPRDGE